jgi:hypothetical protein
MKIRKIVTKSQKNMKKNIIMTILTMIRIYMIQQIGRINVEGWYDLDGQISGGPRRIWRD